MKPQVRQTVLWLPGPRRSVRHFPWHARYNGLLLAWQISIAHRTPSYALNPSFGSRTDPDLCVLLVTWADRPPNTSIIHHVRPVRCVRSIVFLLFFVFPLVVERHQKHAGQGGKQFPFLAKVMRKAGGEEFLLLVSQHGGAIYRRRLTAFQRFPFSRRPSSPRPRRLPASVAATAAHRRWSTLLPR